GLVQGRFVLVYLDVAGGHAEVHNGEQHEDVRLDGADEQVIEGLPYDLGERDRGERQQRGDHRDHDDPREQVAEKSKGQCDGLGDLFNHVDQQKTDHGFLVVAEVTTETTSPEGFIVHPDDHQRRHSQGQVHVTGRRGQNVTGGTRVHRRRQEANPVTDQDEEEQGDTQRHELLAPLAHHRDGEARDHLLDHLPEDLQLAGNTVGHLGGHTKQQEQEDRHCHQGAQDDVAVQAQAEEVHHGVDPDRYLLCRVQHLVQTPLVHHHSERVDDENDVVEREPCHNT